MEIRSLKRGCQPKRGWLVGTNGAITQADVDAQTKTMRDSIGGLSVLPSVSIGLTYRF